MRHGYLIQGYMTSDIQAFSGNVPPYMVSYVKDSSGPNLLLNISIAYPGSADHASQVCTLLLTYPRQSAHQLCSHLSWSEH